MLIKPLYDAYLKRVSRGEILNQYNPHEFLCLPYQTRLSLSGAVIKLTDEFKKSSLSYCEKGDTLFVPHIPLHHFVTNVPNPDLETFVPCSWNDVHIKGIDDSWLMLFSFEYQIILPE